MSRELALIRDAVAKHHPAFIKNKELTAFALDMPTRFNVERLIEETLATIGDLKFVDEDGYDFLPDYSDSKTCSVNAKDYSGTINSVENKIGSLRITMYNPFTDGLAYFFIHKKYVDRVKSPCYGKNSHKERIQYSYSKVHRDHYGWLEEYRVDSFKELAKAR